MERRIFVMRALLMILLSSVLFSLELSSPPAADMQRRRYKTYEPADVKKEFKQSDMVFVGVVESMIMPPDDAIAKTLITAPVTYQIDTLLKGRYENSKITVVYGLEHGKNWEGDPASPVFFKVGDKLIVFVRRIDNGPTRPYWMAKSVTYTKEKTDELSGAR
jgi:hypothetical protein